MWTHKQANTLNVPVLPPSLSHTNTLTLWFSVCRGSGPGPLTASLIHSQLLLPLKAAEPIEPVIWQLSSLFKSQENFQRLSMLWIASGPAEGSQPGVCDFSHRSWTAARLRGLPPQQRQKQASGDSLIPTDRVQSSAHIQLFLSLTC